MACSYGLLSLVAVHEALEGYLDSSRVARLARRMLQYAPGTARTVQAWQGLSYEAFLAEVAALPDLAGCGPQTYAEWQHALAALCAGDPPSQTYPYTDAASCR